MRCFRRSLGGAYICRELQKWRDMFNQLTQKDIEAMEAEIEERKLVIRPRLLEAVKEARAHGDLSENFEYYAAKREKNKNKVTISGKGIGIRDDWDSDYENASGIWSF